MSPGFKLVLQAVAVVLLSMTALPAFAQSDRDAERRENERDLDEHSFKLGTLNK